MKESGTMRYVLGIDSGGTKYLVRAARLDGTLLGMFTGPTLQSLLSKSYADAGAYCSKY